MLKKDSIKDDVNVDDIVKMFCLEHLDQLTCTDTYNLFWKSKFSILLISTSWHCKNNNEVFCSLFNTFALDMFYSFMTEQ